MTAKGTSLGQLALARFISDHVAMFGLLVIAFTGIVAAIGPWFVPDQTPNANAQHIELAARQPGFSVEMIEMRTGSGPIQTPVYKHWRSGNMVYAEAYTGASPNEGDTLSWPWQLELPTPSKTMIYWLGTDRFGRDMLSRMVLGARVTLGVGFVAVAVSLIIGISIGAAAGFFGGWVDKALMWFVTVVWSIPLLLLVIGLTLALGKGLWQVFVAVGLAMWVEVARVVRGEVIALRGREFIEACKALGYTNLRIISRHLLPNIMGPVIVIAASNFASAILIEAGLSFLGIGAQPPTPTWGGMIKDHYSYIVMGKPHLALVPGLAIMLLVLAFTLVGNGLRDALDVKRRD